MKKFASLIVLIMIALQAIGQNASQKNMQIQNVEYVGMELLKNYHPNADSTKDACLEACVFIKFKNENNKFTNIAYTKNTPVYIQTGLTEAFKAIEPLLKTKKVSANSTIYIQPFQYTYNRGCGFSNILFDGKEPDEKEKQIYKEKQASFSRSSNSIWDITNFTDGWFGPINCVLLTPIRVSGEMY